MRTNNLTNFSLVIEILNFIMKISVNLLHLVCFNQSMSQNSLVSISLRKKKINKLIENLKEGKINKNFQDRSNPIFSKTISLKFLSMNIYVLVLLSRFHETIIIPTAYEQRENQIQCKVIIF